MKKQEETKTVQMNWKEDDFRNRYFDIVMRSKWWGLTGAVTLVVMAVISMFIDVFAYSTVITVVTLTWATWFFIYMYQKGKKYWEDMKNKEEPIKLEPVKWWWQRGKKE